MIQPDVKPPPPSAKKMNSKDKLVGKTSSLQMSSLDGTDGGEKSPLVVQKRKSTSIDIMNLPITTELLNQISNGGTVTNSEEKLLTEDHITSHSIDTGESFDSGNEIMITNNNTTKSVLDINKTQGSMQVSQV